MQGMHGVVAGGDPQTARAGALLLEQGGNAVDAALAAAFAAFVCELPLCSPLGGGVMVLEHAGAPATSFDMFARTPGLGGGAGEKDFVGIDVSFGAATQRFHVGRASVAVPLTLPGFLTVHRRFGKLPLAEVLAPAIALAKDGYVLGPGLAFVFEILRPIVTRTPECWKLFADPASGDLGKTGARLRNPDLARTFQAIADRPDTVRDLFAQLAREFAPSAGGLITAEDVAHAAVTEHEPVTIDHGAWRLATMPFPSTGGVLVALGLRLLEGVGEARFCSLEHMLDVVRVQEALLAERDGTFAARCADPASVLALLADERVAVARRSARRNLLGSTTQISAIDEQGTAVSMTLTSGEGSSYVLSGTGMITNNLLGEEDLHPRGFHQDAPGTPINTMMAPTIVSRGGDRIALGSGGSNRLRTAILQVLVGLLEFGLSDADAVAAPRAHLELPGGIAKLALETAGLAPDVAAGLLAAYPSSPSVFTAPNLYFGGVHLATRIGGEFAGVGDARRGGACVVV